MDTITADVRYAFRKLIRAPVFALVAIATVALGIGANTAIFSVVYGVLMRPLPFDRPEELVRVYTVIQGDSTWANSATNFLELRQTAPSFAGLLLYDDLEATLTGAGEPTVVQAAQVSAGFFDVLGIRPVAGRFFEEAENEVGRGDVVVISHGFWQDHFGGAEDAVGRTLTVNGRTREVVGVAERGFRYPDGARLWLPVEFTEPMRTTAFGNLSFEVLGRLAPGASVERARAEVRAQAATVKERFPTFPEFSGTIVPLLEAEVGSSRTPLLVLLAAVGFVLLIACANIANLLLARAASREGEFAVRRALGAGRRRIVQQLLVESLAISLAGAVVGISLALWATDALIAMSPEGLPRVDEIRLDGVVLMFSLGIALLTGALFGLVPALHLARRAPAATLKLETRTVTAGANSARSALLVVEMALAVVLLAGAGLLINSFVKLTAVRPGFDYDNAVAVRVWLPQSDFPDWDRVRLFHSQVSAAAAELPGVRGVGAVQTLPLEGSGMQLGVFATRNPPATPDDIKTAAIRAATAGWFETVRIPLLSGRYFDSSDRAGGEPAMILSRAAAQMIFGGDDPLGEQIELTMGRDGAQVAGRVVGVVEDTRVSALAEEPRPVVYMAFDQVPMRTMQIVIRTDNNPLASAEVIRAIIHRYGPNLPATLLPLDHVVHQALAQTRFYTLVLGAFALTALILAAVGIFGVFSFMVEQRRREIGIRIALGARSRTVVGMIVQRAGRLALIGVGSGLVVAWLLTGFLGTLLYGVGARDPLTFVAVAAVLGGVALFASWLPARSAARLDPLTTLRPE